MINDERCKKGRFLSYFYMEKLILEVSSTPLKQDTQGFNSGVDALEGGGCFEEAEDAHVRVHMDHWLYARLRRLDREIRVHTGYIYILYPTGSVITLSLCSISILIDLPILPEITTPLEYFYHPLD